MTVRRAIAVLALAALVVVAVLAAAAPAQELPPPTVPVEEPRIPEGVTIAGLAVGGMTAAEAKEAVEFAFALPLRFVHRGRTWQVSPEYFGAVAYVQLALGRAFTSEPGARVPLAVRIRETRVARYVGRLARRYYRPARNSTLSLRDLKPYITRARAGRALRTSPTRTAITRTLRRLDRVAIRLPMKRLEPSVTRSDYGSIIVVRRGSRTLTLYDGMRYVTRFSVAVGMAAYPTPLGRFSIVSKEVNPTWNPPDSDWAAGMGPIPPGPGNPLGTRWMGLSIPGYGIHGTYADYSIGTAASHGCIRMHINQNEWLFARVSIGTPVFIVSA